MSGWNNDVEVKSVCITTYKQATVSCICMFMYLAIGLQTAEFSEMLKRASIGTVMNKKRFEGFLV